jgi:uncharacterized protein YjbI with pentapeptide repeats
MALRLLLKVAFLIFATNGAALSAEQLEELCPHPKGWKPTNEQLAHILVTHANWLEKLAEVPEEEILQKFVKGGRGRAGRVDPSDGTGRANLCNADLRGVQFDKRILRNAMLNGINLANEHLSDFDFGSVDLNDADLSGAKLSGTKFNRAELKRANLNEAELNNAHFFLSELEGANFSFAKLNSAGFEFSGLENVDMRDTELKNAGLFAVTLKGAQLAFTKLDEASLLALTLENARLLQVSVAGAHFSTIDFTNMDYSSRSAAPASVTGRITGLSTVTFDPGEEIGLVQLRDLLQKSGLRDYERQATYAIENGKTRHAIDDLHENPSAAA